MLIMAVGMAIALWWHGWQGWGLGKGYPYNTFLFKPEVRFTDLTDVIGFSVLPCPYANPFAGYLPSSYVVFFYMSSMPPSTAIAFVLSAAALGFLMGLIVALFPLFWKKSNPALSLTLVVFWSFGLALGSYPLWLSMDRCNIELLMAAMVTMALLCFQRRFFWIGLLCLLAPVCFKTFPILLAALFVRHGHLWKVITLGLAAVVINFCSLASFSAPVETSWQLWHHNLTNLSDAYVIHNWGLAGSASPWNAFKAWLETYIYLTTGASSGNMINGTSHSQVQTLYFGFTCVALITVITVVVYCIFFEREFYRRAILLLILMSLVVPNGSDYRLLYANIALIILIVLPSHRRFDLLAIALLAFMAIPKKEIFLDYLGTSDSGAKDINIGVLLNSPCMLAALTVLIVAGWPNHPWMRFRQKFSVLFTDMLDQKIFSAMEPVKQTRPAAKRKKAPGKNKLSVRKKRR